MLHCLLLLISEELCSLRHREQGKREEFSSEIISLPLGLALGSPIFPSGCEGKLGESHDALPLATRMET